MSSEVSASALERMLHDGDEIAVADVREHGEYGAEHLLFCTPMPFSRFELELPRLLPNRGVRLVIYDQRDGAVAARTAAIAEELGYRNVMRLEGGIEAWKAAGYSVFAGVHVPSKTFGELVEHAFGTPSISAEELAAWQRRGEPVVVLDGRPWEEYRAMNIPDSISCPNGELAYRAEELVGDGNTPVVVNCAGRTRSIIGCEMLRQFGMKNPVYALRNGTMGWRLAGLELEHGSTRRCSVDGPVADVTERRRRALQLAESAGVARLSPEAVRAWLADAGRTTYLLDVRDPREYGAGHLEDAIPAPGGQLIQATETYVGVRRARLVLVDDTEVRAAVCGFWLAQMGYEVAILAGGADAWWSTVQQGAECPPRATSRAPRIPATALAEEFAAARSPLLLDCQPSLAYSRGHAPGAQWVTRSRLAEAVEGHDRNTALRIVGRDDGADDLLAADLVRLGFTDVAVLDGGMASWRAAGRSVEASPDCPPECDRVDYLFFAHDRHAGNLEAAKQYLAWEQGLVEALTPEDRAHFALVATHGGQRP